MIQYPSHTIYVHCVAEIVLHHYFLPVKPVILWYPVTPAMGKPSFDEPGCMEEIKLKTEETKPISKFFSKKGFNSAQGSSLGSTDKEVVKMNQPKSLKEEPETEDSPMNQSQMFLHTLAKELQNSLLSETTREFQPT
ncbi:hypothetical protein Acr_15g0004480 [Actinidia rufa]|uniref:Uncharacterized protein n=1 Tax=Actinidia rufa TaxID=165716 RepID=A0A7J0FT04_9ERIC|nr:hypothetical protein Acr_15g0004480 [Actinidia rufa]